MTTRSKIFLLTLILLISQKVSAQYKGLSSEEIRDRNIRSIKIKSIWIQKDSTGKDHTGYNSFVEEYNRQGKPTRTFSERYKNSPTIFKYDKRGLLIRKTYYKNFEQQIVDQEWTYAYGKKDELTAESGSYSADSKKDTTFYEYDSSVRLIAKRLVSNFSGNTYKATYYKYYESGELFQKTLMRKHPNDTVLFQYDKCGNITSVQRRKQKLKTGHYSSKLIFCDKKLPSSYKTDTILFEDQGLKHKKVILTNSFQKTIMTYHENNELQSEEYSSYNQDGKLTSSFTAIYNEQGKVSKEIDFSYIAMCNYSTPTPFTMLYYYDYYANGLLKSERSEEKESDFLETQRLFEYDFFLD